MKYIEQFREGDRIAGIYLCKTKGNFVTKNGKPYISCTLQDKTGTIDGKIWDINSMGVEDFDALDYIDLMADVTSFNNTLQMNIKRVRRAHEGSYNPGDYLPVSRYDIDGMYQELLKLIDEVENLYLNQLLKMFFVEDEEFIRSFKNHSAAKSVHHGFVGGLLEHTLSVTKLCRFYTTRYPVLNKSLLLSAAMFHDIGKTKELSLFPTNDYTDSGQLLGHIIMGYEMVNRKIAEIPDFPEKLARELGHCILAHHGELEYGSPKKPALPEALALFMADNTDAKMETITEIIENHTPQEGNDWLGYNKLMESNLRKSGEW